jgi:peptidoglycan/LPS O-acetylase OafA/YrhL
LDKLASASGLGASAPKPLAHHDFRPDINGLRALAVLAVLAFHAGLPVPGGFAGVDIFFVISGFLISRIILSERAAGAFSLLSFYGKRVKRILPALLLVLFSGWAASYFLLDPTEFRRYGGHMEASSYFSVNLWLYRNAGAPGAYFLPNARYFPLLHLWSLSIEEQFYLVWPALMLGLFKARRFLAPAVVVIFLVSLVFCIIMTVIDTTAAFYFLSTRAWELALGAMLALREVFWQPDRPSPRAANLGAGLGLFMMLFSVFWLLNEAAPWPGFLALVPTVGCALVIASPGARISQILFGNRVAQFFGLISYPLYLWHWPLLSFAHNQIGDHLPASLTAGLLGLSVLLAYGTWRFVEGPVAAAYSRRPLAVAAPLLAGLALAGLLGSVTRSTNGFPHRFPDPVLTVFNYQLGGGDGPVEKLRCSENRVHDHDLIDMAREKAKAFFSERKCVKLDHPGKPVVVFLGDSHVLHLLAGLRSAYGDNVNIVMLSSLGCAPLIAQTDWRTGITGSPRCRAVNEEIFRNIVELKPAAIVVSAYFVEFYHGYLRYLPDFLKQFDTNVAALRHAGVHAPMFVMGEVPTWSPGLPILVGREVLAGRVPSEFSRENLNLESLEIDALFAAHKWGDNVFYISQAAKLCGEQGCRRFVGPRVPDDMIATDYGHYSNAGSIYAVKNFLVPALAPALAAGQAQKSN